VRPIEALTLPKITPASAPTVVCREPETVVVVPLEIASTVPLGPNVRVAGFPMYLAVWVVVRPGGSSHTEAAAGAAGAAGAAEAGVASRATDIGTSADASRRRASFVFKVFPF